jgi:PelA/Pel-15E family pectate lyase
MKKYWAVLFFLLWNSLLFPQKLPSKDEITKTMKRATRYMTEYVGYHGGYVWSYLPDLSREWGEMESYRSMIWIQPPGTPSMGHLFLDAYHATDDDYYYNAAQQTAKALIKAQHPSGGWNYMYDFEGENAIKYWYETIGANGWRLEEFHKYYGNATFDDGSTYESATFLLRLYLEKKDPEIKTALDKAIDFVLTSQYPNGGWPQRYPLVKGKNYTNYITFNDDVAVKNILFLIMCYNEFNDERIKHAIYRGMDCFLDLQMPAPQPGWAMQYDKNGKPAPARSYETTCLSTTTTVNNLYQLMYFYTLTGNSKFMDRIPDAIDWLEELRLPDSLITNDKAYPAFVELKTNRALYVHRKGSNVCNGKYFINKDPQKTVTHYTSTKQIDVVSLRKSYNKIISQNPDFFKKNSPLENKSPLPRYFTKRESKTSDLNSRDLAIPGLTVENVNKVITNLNEEGYWPTTLTAISHPYIGKAPDEDNKEDYSTKQVGDKYDTSPYIDSESKIQGISTGVYIKNMSLLIEYLVSMKLNDDK